MTPPLIKHCEDHLGSIVGGWSTDAAGARLPFQVALFEKSPLRDVRVLCTLGLSNVPLRVGDGPRALRQELLAMFREPAGPGVWPGVLQRVGMEALEKQLAYVPGDVVGPRQELHPGATVSALYTAVPVYLPESFHVCRSTAHPIVFAWMVPITEAEAAFVRARGRDAFEDALKTVDPDLLDTTRRPIV